jgi:outer membrane protein
MFRKLISCFAVLLLLQTVSQAQRAPWTFSQCLDTALQRNITVAQSKLTNELNKVTLEQSKAQRIPSVSASASEGLSFGWSIDPTTNSYVDQAYNSTNLGLSSSLNLFNGLQTQNTIRRNKLNVEAGGYDVEKTKNEITLGVTTAYLQLLFAMDNLEVALRQEESTTAQAEQTRKMVAAGKVPESNLLQIRSQLATDNLAVINARNTVDLARITLMQIMEIPFYDGFDVVRPQFEEPAVEIIQTSEQVYSKALLVMPQVSAAQVRSNSSLYDMKISEGARYPRLNIGANLNTNYSSRSTSSMNENLFLDQLWNNLGQSFNLSLSIPIYSNRQIKSNIDRAKINSMNTRLNEQSVKNQLRKQVEQTYTDLKSARKKYDATKEQVSAVENSYKNSEKKYEVGLLDAISFLVEKNNYTKSLSGLLQAKYDYIFKQKILDFYLGNPITF